MHVSDEAKSTLVHGADQSLRVAVVADGAARRADSRVQRCVRHNAPLPDGFEQLVLADDPAVVLHQIGEHVEHLRFDRHDCTGSPQFLLREIDFICGEAKDQVSLPKTDADRTCPWKRAKSDRRWPRQIKRYHDFRNTEVQDLSPPDRHLSACNARPSIQMGHEETSRPFRIQRAFNVTSRRSW